MSIERLDRRTFLRLAGGAAAAAAAMAAGVPLVPHPAGAAEWGLRLKALTEHEGTTLLRIARALFPHRTLEDVHYGGVVSALDDDAASSAETARLLKDGIAALDRTTATVRWVDLSRGYQLAALQAQPKLLEAVKVHAKGARALAQAELRACAEASCPDRTRLRLLAGYLALSDGDPRAANGPYAHFLRQELAPLLEVAPRYVGRPAAAAPAVGSHRQHGLEQARLVDEAFS